MSYFSDFFVNLKCIRRINFERRELLYLSPRLFIGPNLLKLGKLKISLVNIEQICQYFGTILVL